MYEIHPEDLRHMHDKLTDASVHDYVGIACDVIRLKVRCGNACSALKEARTLSQRVAADLAQAQAERDALKARLAALPDVADPRDPPVEGSAEAAVKRLFARLMPVGSGIQPSDFAPGIVGLVEAVEEALDRAEAERVRLVNERDHVEAIAREQFERRLHGI